MTWFRDLVAESDRSVNERLVHRFPCGHERTAQNTRVVKQRWFSKGERVLKICESLRCRLCHNADNAAWMLLHRK